MGWGNVGLALFSLTFLMEGGTSGYPLRITCVVLQISSYVLCRFQKVGTLYIWHCPRSRPVLSSSQKPLVSAVVASFPVSIYIYLEYNGAINIIHSGSCQYLNRDQLKSGWVVNLPYDISAEYAGGTSTHKWGTEEATSSKEKARFLEESPPCRDIFQRFEEVVFLDSVLTTSNWNA